MRGAAIDVISVPHSRVDDRGNDVHDEVGQGNDHGEQGHDALNGHEVAGLDELDEHEAEALPLEGRLGQYRAAEEQGDLQADHGDDGDECRAVRVHSNEPEFTHAAGAGGVD